jgi:hypothetical protein
MSILNGELGIRQQASVTSSEAVDVVVKARSGLHHALVYQKILDSFPSAEAWGQVVAEVPEPHSPQGEKIELSLDRPGDDSWLLVHVQAEDVEGRIQHGRYIISGRVEQWTEPAGTAPVEVLVLGQVFLDADGDWSYVPDGEAPPSAVAGLVVVDAGGDFAVDVDATQGLLVTKLRDDIVAF